VTASAVHAKAVGLGSRAPYPRTGPVPAKQASTPRRSGSARARHTLALGRCLPSKLRSYRAPHPHFVSVATVDSRPKPHTNLQMIQSTRWGCPQVQSQRGSLSRPTEPACGLTWLEPHALGGALFYGPRCLVRGAPGNCPPLTGGRALAGMPWAAAGTRPSPASRRRRPLKPVSNLSASEGLCAYIPPFWSKQRRQAPPRLGRTVALRQQEIDCAACPTHATWRLLRIPPIPRGA